MRTTSLFAGAVLLALASTSVEAAASRVVVVQATDAAGYLKAIEQGKALLKTKGSPGAIRVWRARFAGDNAGAVVVTIEYPNLEMLAKDDGRLQTDPELRAWVQSLDKYRKIVSDSIYEEMTP